MTERSLDTLLQLVAGRYRRQAIQQLRHEANGTTTLDDLVDAMCDGGSPTDDHATDREQLAILLYHVHLPKLADHGVVEFDPENRVVRYQRDGQIEGVLDALPPEMSIARR